MHTKRPQLARGQLREIICNIIKDTCRDIIDLLSAYYLFYYYFIKLQAYSTFTHHLSWQNEHFHFTSPAESSSNWQVDRAGGVRCYQTSSTKANRKTRLISGQPMGGEMSKGIPPANKARFLNFRSGFVRI